MRIAATVLTAVLPGLLAMPATPAIPASAQGAQPTIAIEIPVGAASDGSGKPATITLSVTL